MSRLYNCRPSDILKISDSYTAFCFDEACAYIRAKLDSGEEPKYNIENKKVTVKTEYSNFKDFYKSLEG